MKKHVTQKMKILTGFILMLMSINPSKTEILILKGYKGMNSL